MMLAVMIFSFYNDEAIKHSHASYSKMIIKDTGVMKAMQEMGSSKNENGVKSTIDPCQIKCYIYTICHVHLE